MKRNEGVEIRITKDEFKALPQGDQNWLLFLALETNRQRMGQMDDDGCRWGQDQKQKNKVTKLQIIGSSIGGGLGLSYIIGHLLKLF